MLKNYTYNISTLSSGLRLLHIPFEEAASVYVSMIGKVGRRAEMPHEMGAAHFLEHQFGDGTKKRPTPAELYRFVDAHGIEKNAFTSQFIVQYLARALPQKADACMDLISDIFNNSLLLEESFERQRKVIKEEAAMKHDNPAEMMARKLYGLLYPNQAMGRTIFDEELNLPNMTREIILDYQSRAYVAENFLLCVGGAIRENEACALGEQYFAGIRRGKEITIEPAKLPSGELVQFIQKSVKQARIQIVFPGFKSFSRECGVARLLGMLLGGMPSSRLYLSLRSNLHLVYGVSACHEDYLDTGFFRISTNFQEEKLSQLVDATYAEIHKIMTSQVADEELKAAKVSLLTNYAFSLEPVPRHVTSAGIEYLLRGSIKDPRVNMNEIESITKEEILAVAKQIFSEPAKILVLADKVSSLQIPKL